MAYLQHLVSPFVSTWCSRISCVISIFVVIFLLFHQKYKLAQKRKESMDMNSDNNNSNRKDKRSSFGSEEHLEITWSLICSYLLMISSIITLSASILIEWSDKFSFYNNIYKYVSYTIAIGYGMSKFCLYILLSFRIEESFINSAYSYNKIFLFFWRIFLFVGIVFFFFSYLMYTKIDVDGTNTNYSQWVIIYIVGFDVIACGVNLILFTRQLWSFTEDCNQYTVSSNSDYQFVTEFKTIIKKQVLLATLSIFSTILALIIIMLFAMPILCISFDLVTTNICVILMFSWNHKYVMFCCGKCLHKVINDSIIESIALSKVPTGRSSKISNISHPTIPPLPSTPSLTMTGTTINSINSTMTSSFPNFTNNQNQNQNVNNNNNSNGGGKRQKLKMTSVPSLTVPSPNGSHYSNYLSIHNNNHHIHYHHNNEFSSSFSIDLSQTKTITAQTRNSQSFQTRNGEEKEIIIPDKIDEEPELSIVSESNHINLNKSRESESNISIHGLNLNIIQSPQSAQSVQMMETTTTPTPHSTPTSFNHTRFPIPISTTNKVLDDIDEDDADSDDEYNDDEIP